ncbi:MAG: signal recognition particle-docking protein FtsY [Candidatus Treponema excrementipullorum]|nr:signal recognition particle-docking protein FtsY [Spirochaetia bacterium]MDY2756969.1 signal recognition particle-docking protein FtsY [Candidatus Treponema excrementipullorum]MCI6953198.1 signal recognition particle-docking protein FtsY [Spirochaetia bacterium]MCI7589815.1 signal recognition particle-docking protein FtsY [Spirochaetia bacterium]MDY4466322.1 signal recognition particle-docking protein FtsY [Candidatus Treponema excrementipullorum]
MAKMSFAERLKNFFSFNKNRDDSFFEDLSDILIEGDLGAKNVFDIVEELEKNCKKQKLIEPDDILSELKTMLLPFVSSIDLTPQAGKVNVYMLLGVNGVGKTTSVAKLANYYKDQTNVIMAAADTFRAAAIEQLQLHGQRLNVRVVAHQHGADPSAVVFDAAEAVRSKGEGLVLADTAGRLHNKENLVRELQKIDRIAASKADEGCYKKLLIIDSTTGQNGLRQAEVFHQAVGLDAVILTKYDSTAKGGVAAAIGKDFGIPVAFVCFGEGYKDIRPFDPETYLDEFLGIK